VTAAKRVVVVGAGIVGASIAWHLASAGSAVTVIDAEEAGGVATRNSFAWINASWGNPEPYFRLRHRSMALWRWLGAALPDIPLTWTGGLCFDLSPADLETYALEHGRLGYGIRKVGRAEAARLEPSLAEPPELAMHIPEEGAVEPALAATALIADAARKGARIHAHRRVIALVERDRRIMGVETEGGAHEADDVVLAAGVGTAALAAFADVTIPMSAPPGLIVHSRPYARLLNGVVLAPDLHMRQTASGRVIAAAEAAGGDPGPDAAATAHALFARLKAMLRGAEGLVLDFHTVGHRAMPGDGFPIIGRAGRPGLYIAVMHSGVTLAPAIGQFVADELLTGHRDPLLGPYGPERFR
jgi:glycine/D-amino acid oxidase-like deaminating enzyme